jgi:DNA-binding NtrC family response regulator
MASMLLNDEEQSGPAQEPSDTVHNLASILIFDEEADSCNLLRRVLEPEGYQVETYSESSAALRQIASNPPDIVIAHIRHGSAEEIDLIKRIERMDARVSIITISDYFSESERSLSRENLLIKPVEIQTIESKVRELLSTRTGYRKQNGSRTLNEH